MNAALLVFQGLLTTSLPQSDAAMLSDATRETPSLLELLGDAGVADPERIADYVHLLPSNTTSASTVRGETEITIRAADGSSYTISSVRLTLQDSSVAFRAVVEGYEVAGTFTAYSPNQIKLEYQFQVPLDVYDAPPGKIILGIRSSGTWLPTARGERSARMATFFWPDVKTQCKCIGKGQGDGACVQLNCDRGDMCGAEKECLDTQVGGPAGLLAFTAPLMALMLVALRRRNPS